MGQYAETDLTAAEFLHQNIENINPKPFTIICYHCEQSAEKMLKGALAAYDVEIQKTHDLGILVEELQTFFPIGEAIIDDCYDLIPYGVKVRYPQELDINGFHVKDALLKARRIYEFLKKKIEEKF